MRWFYQLNSCYGHEPTPSELWGSPQHVLPAGAADAPQGCRVAGAGDASHDPGLECAGGRAHLRARLHAAGNLARSLAGTHSGAPDASVCLGTSCAGSYSFFIHPN